MINHLQPLDWGEITIDGKHVGYQRVPGGELRPAGNLARARAQARIGMVFQHFNLFEHLTTLENLMEAPIRVYRQPPESVRAIGLQLLAGVGLAGHVNHLPHRLSGGQQQRVAIARALAIRPRLILFDEPTSALDPELVGEVLALIRRLVDAGMTMIAVTHEIRFAREVADRVVFLDEGKVVEEGPPAQVIDNPRQPRTRRFLRRVSQVSDFDVAKIGDAAAEALQRIPINQPRERARCSDGLRRSSISPTRFNPGCPILATCRSPLADRQPNNHPGRPISTTACR